jgi:hypothetical protein
MRGCFGVSTLTRSERSHTHPLPSRYLELVDKKKAAIARWRAEKRKALESEQHGSHHRAEVQQKLEHERKAAAIAAADEERQRKANDVAQWKAEKEARRREEETEKRAAMKVNGGLGSPSRVCVCACVCV